MNSLNLFAGSMDKRLSLWYNEIGQKRRIRIKLLALMVMWRFRVPLHKS